MSAKNITKDDVMKALGTVMDPELNRDLVSLGMIKDVEISDAKVAFRLTLTTPACPLRDKIRQDAYQAVSALEGVEDVEIEMDAEVPVGQKKSKHEGIRNVIAIASGKGGVGKSTVAVNVAVALAEKGAKVGLLDADIYGPNIPTMMGVDRIGGTKEKMILPAQAHGVKMMSIGFLVEPQQALIWRGPMLHGAIKQFISDVEWGELDYLIVDLPPGTGDVQLSLTQTLEIQGGVIVTLPQRVSLDDARRGLTMFGELGVPVFGVVENMSSFVTPGGEEVDIFGSGGGQMLADEFNVPYMGSIPIDPEVRKGGDEGVPVVISEPDAEVSVALRQVAEKIAGQASKEAYQET
ncbi:MAG: Mrp/NBP35 family ATP-binding protein [Anaerolineales bacterium]|nr:Mrp/NBP35 family ATP-binding protein [Anaerolineales bacterium]